jgi:hypothetical protein
LERAIDIITVTGRNQIPSLEVIQSLPRKKRLKIIFAESLDSEREAIGEELKERLDGFLIGIHMLEPEINISKLITAEEVINNHGFFERCAKDYRKLGEKLIFELADRFDLDLSADSPWIIFGALRNSKKQTGTINGWRYYFHGFHCGFSHFKSGQEIEVPLVFSLEFGDLDPYFFSRFIRSTKSYHPLPVEIYEDYSDGKQILETMLRLGKFEHIHSNFGNHNGVVVTDREKVEIKPFTAESKTHNYTKKKFSFSNLFRFKTK